MKLTDMLPSARKKHGPSAHLREVDGVRQVIRYRDNKYTGPRDSTGVEVVAECRGAENWASIGVTKND